MNNQIAVAREVLAFLASRAQVDLNPSADAELDLVESGIFDSLMLVELVTFLEERYGVTPTLDELDLINFATAARVAEFVARRSDKDSLVASEPV